MTSTALEPVSETPEKAAFHKVGENLYRLSTTGGYYALAKKGDKQFRRSLKTRDRKLAERRLAAFREQIASLSLSPDGNLPFEKLAERWLSTVSHALKPSTVQRRRSTIKRLAPFFRGAAIRNITRAHCERWVAERGPTIAPQTFVHELDTMRLVFSYAIASGLLLGNPAAHIKRRRITLSPISVPSREQFRQLVEAIRKSDGRLSSQLKSRPGADLVELLAYSGMRLGEATALRWRDVDFDRNCIIVTGGEAGTKNHEVRVVPMTDALRALLQHLKQEQQPRPDAIVSPIKDAKTTIAKACVHLGLPHFHHHDFRHFFATTCIESGVDIPTISRWLGHKDGGALAMKVYGHLRQEHSFSMIKRVTFGADIPANVVPLDHAAAE